MELKNIIIDNSPAGYLPSAELVHAAEVAYALKRPLLLSGEPGTGKTEFAKWVAAKLATRYEFDKDPIVFDTKSTSIAQDLFYYYDAIAHFRDANIERLRSTSSAIKIKKSLTDDNPSSTQVEAISTTQEKTNDMTETINYISYNALGLAILKAKGFSVDETDVKNKATGSVVLIDEIDKAPRDFPNDLLNEIEKYMFEVKELNHQRFLLSDEEKKKIMIIMTSNFEKNLPEAFLRRCVYFHIQFPTEQKLKEIIIKRLNISNPADIESIQQRITDFFRFRANDNIQKKPSTSECLDYVRVLHNEGKLSQPLFNEKNMLVEESKKYISLLLKKKEDRDLYIYEQ